MDRKDFAKVLFSSVVPEGTPAEEILALTRPVSVAIRQMMPNSLFRFRKVDEGSVDAFKRDIIFAVTADKFNDPYDTLVGYDMAGVEKGVDAVLNIDSLAQLKAWLGQGNDFPDFIKQLLPKEMLESYRSNLLLIDDFGRIEDKVKEGRRRLISSIKTYFPILAEATKRFTSIACFSERVESILMWSHYADSHKGFALEYNFRPILENPIKNVGLFPVIYEEKRLDISLYVVWAFLLIMGVRINNPDMSSSIKSALVKSVDWAYEREWRMIDTSARDFFDERASAIPYKPCAIYYGKNMSIEDKRTLHEIAQEKGIKEYEMYIDYSSPVYEMRFRPVSL